MSCHLPTYTSTSVTSYITLSEVERIAFESCEFAILAKQYVDVKQVSPGCVAEIDSCGKNDFTQPDVRASTNPCS